MMVIYEYESMRDYWNKIRRKWTKLWLQPIRVFCIHHVSDEFDPFTMWKCDWMPTNEFKKRIMNLQAEGYAFISLSKAYGKMKRDIFRYRKYAVLTADDGWASMQNILPWLNEKQIPITLFINPGYLDGQHYREMNTEKYLTEKEIRQLYELYPLVTIGSHGWEHKDAMKLTDKEFIDNVRIAEEYLLTLPNHIPFYAFTYGRCTQNSMEAVKTFNLTPLLVRGGKNYLDIGYIDRELL